jgi:hypothetical protein
VLLVVRDILYKYFSRNGLVLEDERDDDNIFDGKPNLWGGLPSRRSERPSCSAVAGPPSPCYGAAVFALRFAPSEDWCIRQDLNLQPSDPKSEALSN